MPDFSTVNVFIDFIKTFASQIMGYIENILIFILQIAMILIIAIIAGIVFKVIGIIIGQRRIL